MKISNNINQKLAHVPVKHRVFQYDGSILIEFLSATFMPLAYQLTTEALYRIGAGSDIKKTDMKEHEKYDTLFISLYDLYEYYKKFREMKRYSAPVESRYIFSVMVKKLILPKNGWQFAVKRVGRAQLIYVGPCEFRASVAQEVKAAYPVDQVVDSTLINFGPRDIQETTYAESDKPTLDIDPTLVT